MYPTLLSYGELRFHSYTVMMTLAFLIGALGPNWLNNRRANPLPVTPAGGIWVFFGGMAGSKIYWLIQYGEWEDLRWLQFFITGGLVFFGGLIGGIIAGIAYLRYVKAPILPAADMVAPFMAIAHGIGRIGCYLNGCCWGAISRINWPWLVAYPPRRGPYSGQIREGLLEPGAAYSLPVHATQIYETLGLFVIAIILLRIYRDKKHNGIVALSYLTLYGALRFTTECFRGESTRSLLGLTVSQMVGLGLFVGAGLLLFALKKTLWKEQPPMVDPASEEMSD